MKPEDIADLKEWLADDHSERTHRHTPPEECAPCLIERYIKELEDNVGVLTRFAKADASERDEAQFGAITKYRTVLLEIAGQGRTGDGGHYTAGEMAYMAKRALEDTQ